MLKVAKLNAKYGKSHILNGVTFEAPAGQAVGLLGRNGVGKTTTLKAIMGLVNRWADEIRLDGDRIDKLPPDRIARLGVGYVPQGRNIFPHLTVLENIRLAYHHLTLPNDVLEESISRFPILKERLNQPAGSLSGGEQQMLAMARVLSNQPKVLLLDEPVEGLSPSFVKTIGDVVLSVRDKGVAVVLVEQNVKLAIEICNEIHFLEKGAIKHSCNTEDGVSEEIISRYLGVHSATTQTT